MSDDDLTAAYLAGYHKAKTEMKAQNAELIEALLAIAGDEVQRVNGDLHKKARDAIEKTKGET
jgi:hypothetical protein